MNRTELRALFRSLIDDQGINENIFSDPRSNIFLYEGALRVQDMIENLDEGYLLSEMSFIVGGDAVSIGTIDNLNRVISVTITGDSQNREIEPINIGEFARYRYLYGENNCRNRPAYAVKNNELKYYAPYGEQHTVNVVYTQTLADLEDDTESWSLPSQAHRLIAYEAALIGVVSEDGDFRGLERLVSDRRMSVTKLLENRAGNKPDYIEYAGD
jgi:hypothetical protein